MFLRTLFLSLFFIITCASNVANAYNELKGATLKIYVHPSNPPFSTVSKDYRSAVGLDIEIIEELQKRLGFSLEEDRIFPLLRADQLEKMKKGECDMLGGSMSFTKQRAQYMHFTPIYFDSGLGILYSKKYNGEKIKSLADLKGKRVVVINGSSAENFMKSLATSKIIVAQNFTKAALSVAYGRIDAFVYDKPILINFAKEMDHMNLGVTEDLFSRSSAQYAFALPKDSPYFEYIDREIQNMIYDGTMSDIISKYFN